MKETQGKQVSYTFKEADLTTLFTSIVLLLLLLFLFANLVFEKVNDKHRFRQSILLAHPNVITTLWPCVLLLG